MCRIKIIHHKLNSHFSRKANIHLKGFSLIELMIVIAIIGILASIAVPSYRTYIKKARMSEVIGLLSSYKHEVEEPYMTTGQFPSTVHGCLQGQIVFYSNEIGSFHWNTDGKRGWIQFLLVPDLGGGRIQLQAVPNPDGGLSWYCGFWDSSSTFAGETIKYAPASCQRTDLSVLGS